MICSTIEIRPAYKISALYLQNQASYSNFSLVNVMRNLNLKIFSNPEISLKCWDFGPNFCMWSLNIPKNKCYIATWGQKWLLPWFLRGASEAPPGSHRIRYPLGGRVNNITFVRLVCQYSMMTKTAITSIMSGRLFMHMTLSRKLNAYIYSNY